MSGDQDLLFFCAEARQSITNVSCPDHFLFLRLDITCFPVQDSEELTTFVRKSYNFTVHPSWSRRRMTCFEVNILKQSVINGTVGTGQCAAVLLGLPNLMPGQRDFSFDKKQSTPLQLRTARSESFLTILCWCSPSLPFRKVSLSCLPAQTVISLLSLTAP